MQRWTTGSVSPISRKGCGNDCELSLVPGVVCRQMRNVNAVLNCALLNIFIQSCVLKFGENKTACTCEFVCKRTHTRIRSIFPPPCHSDVLPTAPCRLLAAGRGRGESTRKIALSTGGRGLALAFRERGRKRSNSDRWAHPLRNSAGTALRRARWPHQSPSWTSCAP